MTAKKKLQLIDDDNSNLKIVGIVTALPDYMIANLLNKSLNTGFKRYDDFIFPETDENGYSWFYCNFEDFKTKLHLVSNNNSKQKLLPKFKQIDYLIFYENYFDDELKEYLLENIRKINNVTGAYSLDVSIVKNIEILHEQLEIHETETLRKFEENKFNRKEF